MMVHDFQDDYTAVDIETTGLSAQANHIIELGAVKVRNNQVTDTYSQLINPGTLISPFITNLTGITNEMLTFEPTIETVLQGFLYFIEEDIILGHNIQFDLGFIQHNSLKHLKTSLINKSMDTMRISRQLFPEHRSHRLKDLVMRFNLGLSVDHRASADALQTHYCYQTMKKMVLQSQMGESSFIFEKIIAVSGTLKSMSRLKIIELIQTNGGRYCDTVDEFTDYLIVGQSEIDLLMNTKSRKVIQAEELINQGHPLQIICEDEFINALSYRKE